MNDSALHVRRDAWTLPPGDETLHWYAVAVAAMQAKDADVNDPTSWTYQAAMHGTYDPRTLPQWKTCQHGTWFFVSWHRMYVLTFESICRAAIVAAGGPQTWALPYWDYTNPAPSNTIPLPFRDPKSPLYVKQRNLLPYPINDGMGLDYATVTDATPALETIPFEPTSLPVTGFGGQVVPSPIHFNRGFGALENMPHNTVHDAVGGDNGWMADPNTAAQDPIFWLHHANIDRLWVSWIALGGGRADTGDAVWTGTPFTFFAPDGTPETLTAAQVEQTEQLGYVYDRLEQPATPAAEPAAPDGGGGGGVEADTRSLRAEIVGGTSEPVVLTGRTAARSVPVDQAARRDALTAAASDGPRQVLLALDDITAERNPGRPYAVYVNLGDADLGDAAARDAAREYLAGTLSLFGIEQAAQPDTDEHPHPYNVAFDITKLYRRLRARGEWDDDALRVTFRPVEFEPPPGAERVDAESLPEHVPVSVGRISVHYA
jgi:tyrosinase